jgi:hypothetical protein
MQWGKSKRHAICLKWSELPMTPGEGMWLPLPKSKRILAGINKLLSCVFLSSRFPTKPLPFRFRTFFSFNIFGKNWVACAGFNPALLQHAMILREKI